MDIVDQAWLESFTGPLTGLSSNPPASSSGTKGGKKGATGKRKRVGGNTPANLSGRVFCITGTFSDKRTVIKSRLEALGASVKGSVTKAVTDLLAEGDTSSSKYQAAVSKGLPIHDEAWLDALEAGTATPGNAKKAKTVTGGASTTTTSTSTSSSSTKTKVVVKGQIPVDDMYPDAATRGASVVGEYGCTLNQTDIANNHNKYYIIQIVQEASGSYYFWTRWGRVGAKGQNSRKAMSTKADAVKAFEKKFSAKTLNSWGNRANFVKKPKKYMLIAVDHGEDSDDDSDDEDDDGTGTSSTAASSAGPSSGGGDSNGGDDEYLFQGRLKSGELLYIVENDIADVEVDAIVHPTSSGMGTGGQVGQVLARVGGPAFTKAIRNHNGSIPENGAAITAAGNLPAQHVIHVNSPHFSSSSKKAAYDALGDTIYAALECASDAGLTSIAFPSIGSGVNGYPKDGAARTILTAIGQFFADLEADEEETSLDEVVFVLYDSASMACYRNNWQSISSGLMKQLE